MIKHMPNLLDFSKQELKEIIDLGIDIKKEPEKYRDSMKDKTLVMWFEKSSLRTRVSFETGATRLGGHAIYLDASTTHTKKANLSDEVKCLSRYADIMMARVFDHETIATFQEASSVPIINALCDKFHPCQALADMMTIFETIKNPEDATIAYIGDGNNVCNSLIIAAKTLGIKINVAAPKSLEPDYVPDFLTENPQEAVSNADFVYTDTWVSMGDEEKKEKKMHALKEFQVNETLLGNRFFMHCLPAIRGQEVTDKVMESEKSLVYEQAENRMHIQKAIMLTLLTWK